MSPFLFEKLTASELQKYVSELDHAMESHSRWLAEVNRALVCRIAPNPRDLQEKPERDCQFGRWYYGVENFELHEMAEFRAIAEVHEVVHRLARQLLRKSAQGELIGAEEYDVLVEQTERLRQLVTDLRTGFKHNLNLIQKIMGKVFEKASEGVMITDPDGVILSVNRAFSNVTGYTPEEIIGKGPDILYSGRQDDDYYRHMWVSLHTEGQWQGEIWNRRKNGEVYPEWLSITAVKDDEERVAYYVAIFSDITTEKENEERLYQLAHYDPLTQLPNRMLFMDRLRHALSRARRNSKKVGLMFLDLDGFKAVNDDLGHNAGDQLLQQVAQRLQQSLRESDTVARFGGDEFTVVLPDLEERNAAGAVAQKVMEIIARPYTIDDTTAHITASIGISIYPEQGEDPDTLIEKADTAMYQAKKKGKNRFYFFEG